MDNQEQSNLPYPKKIYDYACFLLARRRYSVSEFRNKLEKKFPTQSEETCKIIELFLAKKYLDDNEYARLFTREQLNRKPQGLRTIKQKLRQKGINESTISNTFNEQIIDENELIEQALQKKLKTLQSTNVNSFPTSKFQNEHKSTTSISVSKSKYQQKQKLFRFLASRGFSPDAIMKALRDLPQSPHPNESEMSDS